MKIVLLIFSTLIGFISMSQEFSFPIYFEDALGKKDTIVVGYDVTATNGIDPQFGEIDILNQPWQGPLDVRTSDNNAYVDDNKTYLSKKFISKFDCSVSSGFDNVFSIDFYAEHLPVRIQIPSQNNYIDSCHLNSMFTNPNVVSQPCCYDIFYNPDSVAITGIELAGQEWIHSLYNVKYKLSALSPPHYTYLPIREYTEAGKTIGSLRFYFLPKIPLSTSTIEVNPINIYPNPTNGIINIETEAEITNISIYDALGKCVFTQRTNPTSIDVSSLDAGIYMLKTNTTQSEVFTKIHKL